ncbi:MAG: HAD family hydrolase [Candidatus Bathyarchaeota archaeon]|nr:MAG: HAD family hydrolase [Candidatus Bathyarchaeota archaeon]
MTINAIIFDLDGTLAEFNLDYKAVRAEVMQFLINQGFPPSLFSLKESIFEMLKKAKIYLRNNGKREQEFSIVKRKALSIASEHELKAARETSLLPGVFETLKTLKKMNLKLAIFTINGEKSTNYIISTFHIKPLFDVIITRDAVSEVKPDPMHLTAALEALNVKKDEVLVVGDGITDMKSAKALNAKAVGLAVDSEAVKMLDYAGATHMIKTITDLPLLIAKLNESTTVQHLE